MNRRAFAASLFVAPFAPKLAKLINPPPLTKGQLTIEMMRITLAQMKYSIDRAFLYYHPTYVTSSQYEVYKKLLEK